MIAIGGAIGTGLFLGAGGRLADAGPSLAIAYAVCGVFAFLVVRALGELVLYRPSSGAFVSYAREFLGREGRLRRRLDVLPQLGDHRHRRHHRGRHSTPTTGRMFSDIPQWVLALIALAVVLTVNLISVKIFGEMEFWFAHHQGRRARRLHAASASSCWSPSTRSTATPPARPLITDNGGVFPQRPAAHAADHPGRRLRLRLRRAGRRRGGRDREPREDHAEGDQLDHVARRPLLRRLGGPAVDAAALEQRTPPARARS